MEKLPDRFIEHQKMVFVVSNLHYSEAASLTSNNTKKQNKINLMTVKLKGNSSLEFNNQLRDIEKKVAKNWQVGIPKEELLKFRKFIKKNKIENL